MPDLRPADALLSALNPGRSESLLIGLVGDIHGQHKRPALDLFCRQARPDLLLSTGDLQDYRGGYGAPLLFIRGNHECWSVLAEMAAGLRTPPDLAQIPDTEPLTIGGIRMTGLGGCWSPSGKSAARHITPDQITRLERHQADLVLSHETPIHFSNGYPDRTLEPLRVACGRMRPRIWASGHHHYWDRERFGRTEIVSLGKWPDEWATLSLDRGKIGELERFVPRDPAYPALKAAWRADEAAEKDLLFPLDRAGRIYGTNDPGVVQFRRG